MTIFKYVNTKTKIFGGNKYDFYKATTPPSETAWRSYFISVGEDSHSERWRHESVRRNYFLFGTGDAILKPRNCAGSVQKTEATDTRSDEAETCQQVSGMCKNKKIPQERGSMESGF